MATHLPRNIRIQRVTTKNTDFISSSDLMQGKILIFAVPGAFSPTCSTSHVPGYIESGERIKKEGIDAIYCLTVNDGFVTQAWAKTYNADDVLSFLADGNGELTKALGMDMNISGLNLGVRSKRYTMIVEDGEITQMHLEPDAVMCSVSSAGHFLDTLKD